jgi:hypothetical protein
MKSEVYRTKVDTPDELLDLIMVVIASIQERQDDSDEQNAMSTHKLKSAFMLTEEFSKIYCTM